jgi:hypothetical protein
MSNSVWIKIPLELYEMYLELSKEEVKEVPEDFDVYSHAGGNLDDAYEMGYDQGVVDEQLENAHLFIESIQEVKYEH